MMYAHTISNAGRAGLQLAGWEDGQPQWLGTKAQWAMFDLYETKQGLL